MTRHLTRRGLIPVVAAAAVVALAACSGGNSTTGGGNSTTSGGGTVAPVQGVIAHANLSFPSAPSSFDPTKSVNTIDGAVMEAIGARLTQLDLKGNIDMSLAKSITLNKDYTVATVTLKPGVKFSDGTDLTAADVAATFERDKAVKSSTINSLTDRFTSVVAKDSSTAVFTFKAPFPSFANAMANDGAVIFPKAGLAKGASFFALPVAAGQYKLVKPWGNNQLTIDTNSNYFGSAPSIKQITFTSNADSNSVVSQLKSGQQDLAVDLPPSYLSQLKSTKGFVTRNVPGWGFYDLRLNTAKAPLNNVNVRNAIDKALDRQTLVQAIWAGQNQVLGGVWPSTLEGYNATYNTPQDIPGAKSLLTGTACANGCTLEMMYSDADFPFASQLVLLLQSQLKQIGITVKLDSVDQSTLVTRLFAGQFQMNPGANNSDGNYPDALASGSLLSSSGIHAEFTNYNSPAMDKLVQQDITTTGAAREQAALAIGALFNKDHPFVTYATRVRGQASDLPASAISIVGTSLVIAAASK